MMEMQTDPTSSASKPKLKDVEAQVDDEEDEEARKQKESRRSLITRIIQGSAVASIVLNLISMILAWSGIMATAGIVGIGVAGGVIYFQQELRNEDTLREVQNELRHKVNDFAEENNKLSGTVTRLEGELVPLKESETKLKAIAEQNGSSVDKLKKLVKENSKTLKEMKENLEADVMATMMDVIFKADRSEDGMFDEREIQGLILRFKMLPTIEMNEELFKKKLEVIKEEKQQISAILNLIEQVHHDDISENERVFKLSEKAMEDVAGV